ncbi:MAG: hypothetical protein R6U08_09760 [Bacillota bacterium]
MKTSDSALKRIFTLLVRTSQVILILAVVTGLIVFLVARSRIDRQTARIAENLQDFYNDAIEIEVVIDEIIPLELALPVQDILDANRIIPSRFPINTSVPVNTSVEIKEIIQVPLTLPVFGTFMIEVPIDTTIPIRQDIPISTIIDLDTSMLGEEDNVVTIKNDIRVKVPLNLQLSPSDLGLDDQMDGLAELINTLRIIFMLGEIEINWAPQEQEK